jgi:hypothetical protein
VEDERALLAKPSGVIARRSGWFGVGGKRGEDKGMETKEYQAGGFHEP